MSGSTIGEFREGTFAMHGKRHFDVDGLSDS